MSKNIVVWGTGVFYNKYKSIIVNKIKPDFVYNNRWRQPKLGFFDGIKTINLNEIKELGNCTIVVTCMESHQAEEVKNEYSSILPNAEFFCLKDFLPSDVLTSYRLIPDEIVEKACIDGDKKYIPIVLKIQLSIIMIVH